MAPSCVTWQSAWHLARRHRSWRRARKYPQTTFLSARFFSVRVILPQTPPPFPNRRRPPAPLRPECRRAPSRPELACARSSPPPGVSPSSPPPAWLRPTLGHRALGTGARHRATVGHRPLRPRQLSPPLPPGIFFNFLVCKLLAIVSV
jgi:hypothetical protein